MRPRWRNYTPKLDVWATGTTPALGVGATQLGRYLWLPDEHLVFADVQLAFGASGTSAGSGNYMVSLPIPAQVSLGGVAGGLNLQHDRTLGTGTVARFVQSYSTPVLPNVSDSGPNGTNGQHRNQWCQLFLPWQRDAGQSAVTTGNTTQAVTFANTALAIPTAADIVISPTNSSSNLVSQWWLTGVTAAGFTINVNTNPGASGFHFDWKLHMDAPSAVVTDQAPWEWGTIGDVINLKLSYEPAA